MLTPSIQTKVYLALGTTDMRKAMNGLSMLTEGTLELDPFSGHLFAFCNRRRTIIKILYWDRNGFWVCKKKLERQLFRWPESREQVLEISVRELRWLVEGLDFRNMKAHRELSYSTVL